MLSNAWAVHLFFGEIEEKKGKAITYYFCHVLN